MLVVGGDLYLYGYVRRPLEVVGTGCLVVCGHVRRGSWEYVPRSAFIIYQATSLTLNVTVRYTTLSTLATMSRQNSPDILDLDQTTPEDVLSDLSSAIASDNEEAFTSVLTSYVASDRCQRISDLYPIMHQATEYDKPYFLSELLRNGMGFNFSHVHNAVMDKAKRCLEVFFQNGYDINQPLCDTRPSVIQ